MMDSLKTYVFLTTWLGALAGALALVYNVLRNRQRYDGAGSRRLYWPWLLAFVVATAVAWGPVILAHFGIAGGPQVQRSTPERPLADDAVKWQLASHLWMTFIRRQENFAKLWWLASRRRHTPQIQAGM